jgi:fatty-acid peroxygenase
MMHFKTIPAGEVRVAIPRDKAFDSTWALFFSEGYAYISNRCRRFGTDIFATRIMFRNAICIQGEEAAQQFYCAGRFTRGGALPLFVLTLIQDLGSVMVMDREDHERRKAMFLAMMSPESLARISELTARHWRASMHAWQKKGSVTLFHEAHVPLLAAICEWCGLRLSPAEVRRHAREMEAMVEGTGALGPRNWRGHLHRQMAESWLRRTIRKIRTGQLAVPEGSSAPFHQHSYRSQPASPGHPVCSRGVAQRHPSRRRQRSLRHLRRHGHERASEMAPASEAA